MSCRAVKNGEVLSKGKASLEFHIDGKPQYYCYGYVDPRTDELIETCQNCKKNVIYAECDFEKVQKEGNLNEK